MQTFHSTEVMVPLTHWMRPAIRPSCDLGVDQNLKTLSITLRSDNLTFPPSYRLFDMIFSVHCHLSSLNHRQKFLFCQKELDD